MPLMFVLFIRRSNLLIALKIILHGPYFLYVCRTALAPNLGICLKSAESIKEYHGGRVQFNYEAVWPFTAVLTFAVIFLQHRGR